ncbi:MAG TPA: tripartite tricarboxylate transporter substrate-binding protein [Xanthobacteraceae bacterium]|nr:tripartite tricarboxylate transporter substrate-binding protein [Xanthobacteraceae bacterium]
MKIISLLSIALAAAVAHAAPAVSAEPYPSAPIRLVVPFAAGGQTDVMARLLAEHMGKSLGQSLVVENIGGAGGTIGATKVAQARPDGYTLLFGTVGTQVVNQFTIASLPYKADTAFTPIAEVATASAVIVANPRFEASTLAELIALAKRKPGEIQYTTPGIGTSGHLAMELVEYTAGIDMVAIPYKGGAPATTDLIAGHMMLGVDGLPGQRAQIQSGGLKALGVSSIARDPAAPNVPAISETLPGFEATAWFALFGPAKLPSDVVGKLNAAANAALADPALAAKYKELGITVAGGTAQALADLLARETTKWEQVVKSAGITAN